MNAPYLPSGASAVELARYHIEPDVIARYPVIEEWAHSHDAHADLADATDDLRTEIICENVLDGLEMFVERLPDSTTELTEVRALRGLHAELRDFFTACCERLDVPINGTPDVTDSDHVQRILDAVKMGDKLARLKTLRAALAGVDHECMTQSQAEDAAEVIELTEELGL